MVSLFSITPFISHFEHGHFTLAQIVDILKIGEDSLSSLRRNLFISKFQIPENSLFDLLTQACSSVKGPKDLRVQSIRNIGRSPNSFDP